MARRQPISFLLIWVVVFAFCPNIHICCGSSPDSDGEVLIEEEEDTMSLSATQPLTDVSQNTHNERARLRFHSLDTNGDGKLDISELQLAHPSIILPESLQRLLLILDGNQDGFVSEEEMVEAASPRPGEVSDGTWWQASFIVTMAACTAAALASSLLYMCWRQRQLSATNTVNQAARTANVRLARLQHLNQSRRQHDNDDNNGSAPSSSPGEAASSFSSSSSSSKSDGGSVLVCKVPGVIQAAGDDGKQSGSTSNASTGTSNTSQNSSDQNAGSGSSGSGSGGTGNISAGSSSGGGGGNDRDGNEKNNSKRASSDSSKDEDEDDEDGERKKKKAKTAASDDGEECTTASEATDDAVVRSDGVDTGRKEAPVDVRAKRLAKFQGQAGEGDSAVKTASPTTPTQKAAVDPLVPLATLSAGKSSSPVSVKSKQPVTTMATNTTPVQKSSVDASMKKTPAAPVTELSTEDAVGQRLAELLNVNLVLSNGKKYPNADSKYSVTVQQNGLPTSLDNCRKHVTTLFMQRSRRELDTVQFCLMRYNICEESLRDAAVHSAPNELMKQILEDVQDISVSVFGEQLIRMLSTEDTGGLWTSLSNRDGGQSQQSMLIQRFSGSASDGAYVSESCLHKLMSAAENADQLRSSLLGLVATASEEIMRAKRFDELGYRFNSYNEALQVVLGQPVMLKEFVSRLSNEVNQSTTGRYFNKSSVLSSLLNISVFPVYQPGMMDPRAQCFAEIPGFPNYHMEDYLRLKGQISPAITGGQNLAHSALFKLLKKPDSREVVLSWLACVISLNKSRAGAEFRRTDQATVLHASHGSMVNLCGVLLRLCEPFFTANANDRLKKIEPSYPGQPWCRLDLHDEPCLSQSRIVDSPEQLKAGNQRFRVSDANQGKAHFLTECFHLTQRALHIGMWPALRFYKNMMRDLARSQEGKSGEAKDKLNQLGGVLHGQMQMSVLNDRFIVQCSRFYVTQAVWLCQLLDEVKEAGGSEEEIHNRQRQLCSNILEFSIKDMAAWFTFVVGNHHQGQLQSISVVPVVDCCVLLLERPDLLPSPLAHTRIVEMLLTLVTTGGRRQGSRWGAHGELAAIVLASPTVQELLGPALLHSYAAVDLIEGLDVDKEEFDKFSARSSIQKLIQVLWPRSTCRFSIMEHPDRLKRFLNAILDTILYQLNDSLRRVSNVREVQHAMDEKASWEMLGARERAEKEAFLRSEEHVGGGFMKMACETMAMLETILAEPLVAKMFQHPPLSIRGAAAVVEFLETLCGVQSKDLKIKDPEQMNFNPRNIVFTITNFAVLMAGVASGTEEYRVAGTEADESQAALGSSPLGEGAAAAAASSSPSASLVEELQNNAFVAALAEHPDYNDATMVKVAKILAAADPPSRHNAFGVLRKQVAQLQSEATVESVPLADLTVESEDGSGVASAAAQVAANSAWQDAAEAADICMEGVVDGYVAVLQESVVEEAEGLADTHAMQNQFAEQPLDPRSPKVHALMKEVMKLGGNLPLHPASSIFVRQDEDRLDVIRALITGPEDTPYSLGCFAFDIYCPASYPSNPPLVKLITTGNGTVRFNPNLYADGKVCLSLLGTWHGGDASEKWDPQQSSVYQVLVSIQGMILIPDPMYNEPGYERMRGTAEGNARSVKYNASIRLSTVRHAMLGMLRHPPVGFEDTIAVHFALQKDVVLRQLSRWLRECQSPSEEQKLRRAIDEFRAELEKI